MSTIARFLLGLIVAVILLFAGYTWAVLNWSYSEGERAGYVQKLSNKGWLCKTWEGELALITMPGTVSEKFFFSVRNDAVAQHINQSLGKRVSLTYEEHVGVPSSCFAETPYFVTGIKVIENPAPIDPALAAPAPVAPAQAPQPATPAQN